MAFNKNEMNFWLNYAGITNDLNNPLTKRMIEKWAGGEYPLMECQFCGTVRRYTGLESIYCQNCKEYKGMIPYVEWSEQR